MLIAEIFIRKKRLKSNCFDYQQRPKIIVYNTKFLSKNLLYINALFKTHFNCKRYNLLTFSIK